VSFDFAQDAGVDHGGFDVPATGSGQASVAEEFLDGANVPSIALSILPAKFLYNEQESHAKPQRIFLAFFAPLRGPFGSGC
jgi:hypothetical protein